MYTVVGLLYLGWITNFLSKPVISGFMTGAAITIALGQVRGAAGRRQQARGGSGGQRSTHARTPWAARLHGMHVAARTGQGANTLAPLCRRAAPPKVKYILGVSGGRSNQLVECLQQLADSLDEFK